MRLCFNVSFIISFPYKELAIVTFPFLLSVVFCIEFRISSSFSWLFKMKFSKVFTGLLLAAAETTATIYYAGVAESGGEFGVYSKFLS